MWMKWCNKFLIRCFHFTDCEDSSVSDYNKKKEKTYKFLSDTYIQPLLPRPVLKGGEQRLVTTRVLVDIIV